jgi:hypothetical protein
MSAWSRRTREPPAVYAAGGLLDAARRGAAGHRIGASSTVGVGILALALVIALVVRPAGRRVRREERPVTANAV